MDASAEFTVDLENTELSGLIRLFDLMEPNADQAGIGERFAFMVGPARHLREQLSAAKNQPHSQTDSDTIRVYLKISADQIEILSHFIRKVRISELVSAIQDEHTATEASLGLWKLADAARPITLNF